MQARVFIDPLVNSSGARRGEINVTADVLPGLTLDQRIAKNKWQHGLLAVGHANLGLVNADGRYSASSEANSLFALAGADGADVRIEYPLASGGSSYVTIWRGQLTSKGGRQLDQANTAEWIARTPDAAIHEAVLSPGLVSQGQSMRAAITALFTTSGIAAAIPSLDMGGFFDPNENNGSTIAVEDDLLGDELKAADALQELLMAADAVLAYRPSAETAYVMRRGAPYSGLAALSLTSEPLDVLSIEDGSEQVYNQITAETGITGGDQASYTASSEGSISRWGVRSLKLQLDWLRDRAKIIVLVDNLLARLAEPRRAVELRLDGWALPPDRVFTGARVSVDIPAKARIGAASYGRVSYGDGSRYERIKHSRIAGDFYIEQLSRDLDHDHIDIRLREMH